MYWGPLVMSELSRKCETSEGITRNSRGEIKGKLNFIYCNANLVPERHNKVQIQNILLKEDGGEKGNKPNSKAEIKS